MSNKFDLYSYFLKEAVTDDEEDPTQDPSQSLPGVQQAQPPIPQAPQQSSGQANQKPNPQDQILKTKTKADSNVFSNFIGNTISGIDFKKNGPSGGQISIMVSNSNRPIKISWAGDKVTVTQPDGNIVNL